MARQTFQEKRKIETTLGEGVNYVYCHDNIVLNVSKAKSTDEKLWCIGTYIGGECADCGKSLANGLEYITNE